MTIGPQGQNLIFLISQPRAGSTMLQLMLGNHPEIHTLSEPWLLLHPVYALRKSGVWTEYDQRVALVARQEFLLKLPEGEKDYFEGLRRMYAYLYSQALANSAKTYFLDKTPRYYHIIADLQCLFPEARFIILLRNPLAVLSSILRTWTRGRWFLLHQRKHDLLEAPRFIVQGIEQLGESCAVVHYEQLIRDPAGTMEKLCADLELDFAPAVTEYGSSGVPSWRHGDHVGAGQHTRPDPQNLRKWVQDLRSPQIWRLSRDYLRFLGEDTVSQMGYSYDELLQTLSIHKPHSARLWFTIPLWLLVDALNWTERCYVLEHRIDRVIELLGEEGLTTTIQAVARSLRRARTSSE